MLEKKECIVNRMYVSKNGEVCVGLKFKLAELDFMQEQFLRACWQAGTPLSISLELFQNEETHPEVAEEPVMVPYLQDSQTQIG